MPGPEDLQLRINCNAAGRASEMNTQTPKIDAYEKPAFLASTSNSCIGIFRIHAFRKKLSMEIGVV